MSTTSKIPMVSYKTINKGNYHATTFSLADGSYRETTLSIVHFQRHMVYLSDIPTGNTINCPSQRHQGHKKDIADFRKYVELRAGLFADDFIYNQTIKLLQ